MKVVVNLALLVTAAPVAFASAPENDSDLVTSIHVNEITNLAMNKSFVLDDGDVLTRIPYDEYVRETATYKQQILEGCGFSIGAAPNFYWTSGVMPIYGTYACYSIPTV